MSTSKKKSSRKPDKSNSEDPAQRIIHLLRALPAMPAFDDFDDGFMDGQDDELEIIIKRLPHGEGLSLPAYQSEGASGVDLPAAIPADQPTTLAPGARALVPTGLAMQIPLGCEGQVRPRSGLALKHGVTVLNSPGTVDSDYRGEIGVLLINHGSEPFTIARGDRIAQLVFAIVVPAVFVEEAVLVESKRGAGGYGSTGTKSKKR